jgi:myo-inositol-1(or 4)-monophosphatase
MSETTEISERYAFALTLIKDAGDLALGYFRNRDALTIKTKGPQDLASEADLNTELLIKERLAKHYPQDAFLGEETGLTEFADGQGIWVVDPIDGTQPFISGMTAWCVSIGFMKDNVLQFGMVYAPARGELFVGGAGVAATLNGRPVGVHPGKSIREGICSVGYSPRIGPKEFLPMFTRFLEAGGTFHREGTGALALCYVACGRLIGYFEPHINSWDCLGALGVLHAAGLKTNDFLANDGLRKGNLLVAGSEAVFEELSALAGARA